MTHDAILIARIDDDSVKERIKTLTVGRLESLNSIEQKLFRLSSCSDCKLRLPSSLNTRGALGVEVAIVQLIGTWLKAQQGKSIFHSYQKNSSEDFRQLCGSIYGIAALSLVDTVWDTKKRSLPRSMVLAEATPMIELLRKREFDKVFKGHYMGMPLIKRPTYDHELAMPVYNNGAVISSGAFLQTFRAVLGKVVGTAGRYERLESRINVEELSEVLWELFKNTHDHGRHDARGNELPLNFRGVIIQQQDITPGYVEQWCGDCPSEAQSQFQLNISKNSQKAHILDVSVVDMGEGFVDLAMKSSGVSDRRDILLWCLKKGNSRLVGRSRGDGLTKVLSRVSKNGGWIRIRTSNLVLEKTYTPGMNLEVSLEDIREVDQAVVGTTVHISIPLNPLNGRDGI